MKARKMDSKSTALAAVTLLLALALPAAPAFSFPQATVEGTWSTRARENDNGRRWIQLSLELDTDRGTWGWTVDPDELDGLSFAQFDGDVPDARFELEREAGTVTFEGAIRNGRGAGTFAFTPNAAWEREMGRLGFDDMSERRVFQSTIHDIRTDYVRDLQALGYDDLDEDDLFSFAIHGVTTDFIREMNGLGYADIATGDLVTMRIHGVTPDWVRRVRAAMGG